MGTVQFSMWKLYYGYFMQGPKILCSKRQIKNMTLLYGFWFAKCKTKWQPCKHLYAPFHLTATSNQPLEVDK